MIDPDAFEEEEIRFAEWLGFAFAAGVAVGALITWWIWG
jgi:hypothetical protein